ncbi:MAG: ribonuclease Y [Pseudomonadota bacterium]
MDSVALLLVAGALAAGIAIGIILRRQSVEKKLQSVDAAASRLLEEARRDADTIRKEAQLQAKDTVIQLKSEFEKESRDRRTESQRLESWLMQREENLDKKNHVLEQREKDLTGLDKDLAARQKALQEKEGLCAQLVDQAKSKLEEIAGISSAQAKEMLLAQTESEARHEAAKLVKRIEAEAKETADRKAKKILALAISRYSGDYVAEKTVSVVALPNEDMKGRIIGREGRNIRAIEAATGIDLIIDDTPEAVILSGFNPVRREVARIALERLITDGRIHPARIEEVVEKVNQEMEAAIKEAGEQATFDVGVHGIHPDLVKLIGKLKFRTSYTQNVLQHAVEVAALCGIMAAELGLNQKQAKRAGLLHDIGKAVDHEVEGPHALIGADLAKKYGEPSRIIHSIAAHHEDVAPESILAVLVQAADTLSGARPGARKEMLETYIKRLEDLERIATSLPGITKAYAIQAGREVRIIVESEKVGDDALPLLSSDVARRIEAELTYPGQIKVTLIRETRAVDYAR